MFIALLRGINVGGNNKISMQTLQEIFEGLGYTHVKTYINTGNILFSSSGQESTVLTKNISDAIMRSTGLSISTLVISRDDFECMCAAIPAERTQDKIMKTDVMFLRPDIDYPEIVDSLPVNQDIETVLYVPGMLVRHIAYDLYTKSKLPKALMKSVYKQMTVRNVNTVRKLVDLTYSNC